MNQGKYPHAQTELDLDMDLFSNMTLVETLLMLLIAGVCGLIGQAITGYSIGGFLVSIIVGLIGAFLGVWLAGELGLPQWFTLQIGGSSFPIVWSIIGSALFVGLISLLSSRRRLGRR
ncbi:MAG: hypothetical protein WD049_00265 [Candidatus Paceibacterota bacterium]